MDARTQRFLLGMIVVLSIGLGTAIPRLIDREAPRVQIVAPGPSDGITGHFPLWIRARDPGTGIGKVRASLDGRPIPLKKVGSSWTAKIHTTAWPGGARTLRVSVQDVAWRANHTVIERRLLLDHTAPRISVRRDAKTARQGQTWVMIFRVDEPAAKVEVTGFGTTLMAHLIGPRTYRVLRGIWVQAETGETPVRISVTDEAGNTGIREVPVQVHTTAFPFGGIVRLSAKKRKQMGETSKRDASQARRNAAYAVPIEHQLWKGPFRVPTSGVQTSAFGRYRTYNTGISRHHLGVDIANRRGTPVYAGNDGIVTLSESQHTFGEVIILGHGHGVSSSYNHLSERLVGVGEVVRKGQLIGKMGTTGQSTGPHLHWGMEVGGFAVNAMQWKLRTFDTDESNEFD